MYLQMGGVARCSIGTKMGGAASHKLVAWKNRSCMGNRRQKGRRVQLYART